MALLDDLGRVTAFSPAEGQPLDLKAALEAGGETGRLVLAIDWSATPLGPMEGWPQVLRSMMITCVLSPIPMEICWGRELTYLYNDAMRPLLGRKHPMALGRSKSLVFPELWDEIAPVHDGVLDRGESFLRGGKGVVLHRTGYLEECYFKVAASPIADESGVVGALVTLVETTTSVLEERRLRTLGMLGEGAAHPHTVDEACATVVEVLAANTDDVPLSLLYLPTGDGRRARLAGRTGSSRRAPGGPSPRNGTGRRWPPRRAFTETRPFVEPLPRSLVGPADRWRHGVAPSQALVVPLRDASTGRSSGALVLGVNPLRELDVAQRRFLEIVGRHVAHLIGDARAHEAELARAQALTELNRVKTEFLSNVSHELRTPLTLVLGSLRDHLADPDSALDPRLGRIEVALRNARRLTRLVDRLLDYSRIEEGRIEPIFQPVDLGVVTAEVAQAFRPAIEHAGLRLVIDCGALGVPAYIDRELCEKAVMNLISNAVKFTREGEIRVTCRRVGRRVEIAVADTGVGVPAAEVPHLYERFHRVPGRWARTADGLGIGLSLVREVAEVHGGTVWARSEEGVGSTFTVALPLGGASQPPAQEPAAHATLRARSAPDTDEVERWHDDGAGAGRSSDQREVRVLVVEDDPDMRRYISMLLEEQWEVESAADGADALAAVDTRPPDLVLADVTLPVMDGFELLRRLRGNPRTARIPVIMLSARAGHESTVEGLDSGADDYLVKPFSSHELLARLRTHMELARAREAMARDAERHRVARELHDSVLQTLYGIALGSESIKNLVEREPSNAPTVAAYVIQLARSALEEMRTLIFELRPEALELEGLVAAIEKLAAPIEARHGLRVELSLGHEPDVLGDVKQALFRITQEALHNSGRHASATHASVSLGLNGDEIVLEVADDGVGFDPVAEYVGHLGQKTMRERAELVGGTLEVVSAPGRGTRVLTRVPVALSRRGKPQPPGGRDSAGRRRAS